AAVEDIFPSLTVGGTVFVVPEDVRKDISMMREYITQNRTNGGCYSTQFGQLLAMDETPLDVDYFVLGGEAMTQVPNVRGRIINTYGPTEFTVDATFYEVEKDHEYRNIPIGRPLYNCSAYIVNDNLSLVPRGVVGELCLSGPQMADGYWNRPELTAEKFTVLKTGNGETVKVYRTGDLARWNEEGMLEYAGRIDDQVKLRGFRVEPGEVERRALQFAGVHEAAALVRKETLCLYYTADGEVDEKDLRDFMASSLADYMVPGVFVRMEKMPLTPAGKLDRRALPEPHIETAGRDHVPPENETEKKLCKAFAAVLEMDPDTVGRDDDFFDLGGNSIRGMRLVLRADIEGFTTTDLFRLHTPEKIARKLLSGQSSFLPEEEERARKLSVPATVGQISMIDYQFIHAKSVMYNLSGLYRFPADIDIDRLKGAIKKAFGNHPALQTELEFDNDGNIVQRYCPELLSEVSVIDVPADQKDEALKKLVRPFRLFKDSLVRVGLYRFEDCIRLFIDMHHVISDGFSLQVLLNDIAQAY
ncbi:MAG: AMP-binding protein, partial [Lachnospiraceae bacterium]|nr:AMP-binding protein [Lachnospiraceae bacterium]